MTRSWLMVCIAAAMVAASSCQDVRAQTYPAGSITFVVPYAAGGSADIVARLVGTKLQERLGRPVVVENRPGGSEMVATEAVARSNPDGLTIAILSNAIAINETLVPNRRYDLARDLAPVARVIELPFAIMVHPSVPANSIKDLVTYAKANPGQLNYGHLGPGSPHFFTMEWFKRTAGIDIVPVPYRGAAPAYAALVAGEVQVIASGLGAATPFLEAGQARALAALSQQRPASLPGLPTIAEAGYPDFNLRSWMGIFVKSGTPKELVDVLQTEILAAIDSGDVKDRLQKLGLDPSPMKSQEFTNFIQGEIGNWQTIVTATGSKAQ
jgi:tripartite-type tricarboxylate transporter receptor subunit TctC